MDIVCDSVETAEEGSSESDITNCSDGSLSSQSDNRTESDVTSGGKTQYTLLDLWLWRHVYWSLYGCFFVFCEACNGRHVV